MAKLEKHNKWWWAIPLVALLCVVLTGCGGATLSSPKLNKTSSITEVSPPVAIAKLGKFFDNSKPQLKILSPQPNEVLPDTQVAVRLDVQGLPIFKNHELELGPHVHVAVDGQEYKAVYDLSQPISFNLSPGSHTIRAFVSRPWHESFKNQEAYAQVTFHVLTPTLENLPQPDLPLLTYSRPVGTYGAEPVMLDFYIHNPSLVTLDPDTTPDWRVRVTLNGESFVTDRWQPIYLKGLKEGRNWVKLELIDQKGMLIPNSFSSTAHVFTYQPNGTDTLSRIVRGEVVPNLQAIVDPNYVPPAVPEVKVEPVVPEVKSEPPTPKPQPEVPTPAQAESAIPSELSAPVSTPAPAETPAPKKVRKRLKVRRNPPSADESGI
ncbi:MAG: hypothetical protein ACK4QL_00035 [Pseudanabaenaceae cyanobacterium]